MWILHDLRNPISSHFFAQAGRFEVLALRDIQAHEELSLCFGQGIPVHFFEISPTNINKHWDSEMVISTNKNGDLIIRHDDLPAKTGDRVGI